MFMQMFLPGYEKVGQTEILRDTDLEGVANQMITQIKKIHPGATQIQFKYSPAEMKSTEDTIEMNPDAVVTLLQEYHDKGSYMVQNKSVNTMDDNTDDSSWTAVRMPLEMKVGTESSLDDDLYAASEIKDAHNSFSGFGYHRSALKKKVMEFKAARFVSKYLLTNNAKKKLKNKLHKWADVIEDVNTKPVYIELARYMPESQQ